VEGQQFAPPLTALSVLVQTHLSLELLQVLGVPAVVPDDAVPVHFTHFDEETCQLSFEFGQQFVPLFIQYWPELEQHLELSEE
jgi:hypothetical protein